MDSLALRGALGALGLVTLLHGPQAAAASETCYDFSGQTVGTSWPIDPQADVPIGIGTFRVHPLMLDGVVQTPDVARFEVANAAIAGGAKPEMAGIAVAIQMLPSPGVRSIRLRYSHQPGDGDVRAATVEVNGSRHDWRGSFERLNGMHLGRAGLPAHFTVTPKGKSDGWGWQSGTLEVKTKNGGEIRSFTLGAAFLRLDDVCFRNGGVAD